MRHVQIVIPARYQSTRLPGKPLRKIAGVEMIRRVANIAEHVCRTNRFSDCTVAYIVATDDPRIADFCHEYQISVVMTDVACRSGTERCYNAVERMEIEPELVVNLQGDNPLCAPSILQSVITAWHQDEGDLFTPCIHLSWDDYERLRIAKQTSPYSGTTVLVDRQGYALAFSKTLIPTIRNEEKAKIHLPLSPVRQHIGLYAYRYAALRQYFSLSACEYEDTAVEGLEQMRFLYHGLRIRMVEVDLQGRPFTSGVDSPEDVERVETVLRTFGEFDLSTT